MSRVLALLTLSSALAFGQMPDTLASRLAPLRFLIGNWTAVQANGSGTSAFTVEVQGNVVVRKNHAEYPASPGRPAGVHDDLMIVYGEAGSDILRALYVDNEGHEIRYSAKSSGPGDVTFLSEETAGSPLYRLRYSAVSADTVAGAFDFAPPGKPDAFSHYLLWRMVRTTQAGTSGK